ncbi:MULTISPECIES: DUF2235 domain-containing protein [unclassified Luteimonas]|uniref:phospholipase effector Tle1 domain-containing protein n=1 Tax=unclassified Luteimonas TaxID=2629088 RepID=UPI0018F06658|nr:MULTISPECIES: DUF2235 domain-containing protein [unclassified Luteimonas]MBJ6980232.1 DUF2235 domain-containing protein [Luteimonas sp. MC1895]MBJ6985290.1 DUF2235 domain-containing protein [Luteimonas sp. MC1750]QQO05445.1 DUF2235 domain-containing protein [Luteimonas sp. MC1750]
MNEYRLTPDGVQARVLSKEEHSMLDLTRARMQQVRAPRLMTSPHDRLYVAALDGTSNSRLKDGLEALSVVAVIGRAIESLADSSVKVGYLEGVGTQAGPVRRILDGALAFTLEERAEHAYLEFCVQASQWLREDPNARIHLAGIGFSRGAETVALLERLVHERGIRDPDGAVARYDGDGILKSIAWADRPPLVPPGRTAQVAFLVDPVGTGVYDTDRGMPASNVSAVQITSRDEGRSHFTSTQHLPPGLSDQGRMANLEVPGAHSDLGGTYLLDGTGRVVHNFAIDYFNTLLGGERLGKVAEALDPRLYAVHRSEQHLYGLWPDHHYRTHGERELHTRLGPACPRMPTPCLRDAVDPRVAATLEFEHVGRARLPGGSDPKMDTAMQAVRGMFQHDSGVVDQAVAFTRFPLRAQALEHAQDLKASFSQLVAAAVRNDLPGMDAATAMYRATPAGHAFMAASFVSGVVREGMATDRSWQVEREGLHPPERSSAPRNPAAAPAQVSP